MPRPSRYGLLLCIFLAGAVAGVGGRYVADAPEIDGVVAQAREQARAALALLPHMAPRRALAVSESLPARPALPVATSDTAPPAAIVANPGSDAPAPAVEAPAPALTADAAPPASPPQAPLDPPPAVVAAAEPPPPSTPALAPPAITSPPPSAMAAFALLRGDEAMKQRDVIAARRLYEFAASAGVTGAAAAMARSYDPLYLQQQGIRGVPADVATALRWYKRARDDESDTPARDH